MEKIGEAAQEASPDVLAYVSALSALGANDEWVIVMPVVA